MSSLRALAPSYHPRPPRRVHLLPARGPPNSFRDGVVLPFLLIYLHNVRGISLGVAGLAAGIIRGNGPVVRSAAGVFAAGILIEGVQMLQLARRRPA